MKKLEIFALTGEVIERDYTVEELEQYEKDQAEIVKAEAEKLAEAEAKAEARKALLARLGISEQEAQLLLS